MHNNFTHYKAQGSKHISLFSLFLVFSISLLAQDRSAAGLDRVWINVFNDTYGLGSTTLIGFSEDFSDAYVSSEDVLRLATPVSIYSKLASGEELAVNALNTFEVEDSFYLGFATQVQEMQDYRISIQNIDGLNLENASIYLIDTLTGIVTNLKEGDYTFTSIEAVYSNRFQVVFENPVSNAIWDGSSWSPFIPNNSSMVVIAGDYNSCIVGKDVKALALTLDSGITLTICSGNYLIIKQDIIVNGNLSVAHEGSVVQVDDAATVTNNGSITIEKTTPVLAERSFMIMGSPMTAETREGVYANSYIVRHHETANFIPNPDVEAVSPGVNNWADNNGDNWLTHTGILNPGEGYLVFPQPDGTSSGTYTQEYKLGTLNNGVITNSLIFNGTQNASPNVLSNPYASAIDAELFFIEPANTAMDVMYFWEHLTPLSLTYPGYNAANFNMGDISLYSKSMGGAPAANGGATPNNILASGQGFSVKAASAGITATFNNAMRLTGPNDTYRNNTTAERDRVWINVFNDTYGLGSTALIGFSESTSDEFINSEDIIRLATPVSLYSEMESGEELAINALGVFETEAVVSMSFSTQVKETQNYRISIRNMDGLNLENAAVYLIDNLTGSVTNLTESDYMFQSGEATYSKRFKLVFENSALGINDSDIDAVSVYPNPTQNVITIVSPQTIVTSVMIYDIRGRKVSEVNFRNQTTYQIDLSRLESAVYFVAISTENGVITKRVLRH